MVVGTEQLTIELEGKYVKLYNMKASAFPTAGVDRFNIYQSLAFWYYHTQANRKWFCLHSARLKKAYKTVENLFFFFNLKNR
jgi:hypothetical protein